MIFHILVLIFSHQTFNHKSVLYPFKYQDTDRVKTSEKASRGGKSAVASNNSRRQIQKEINTLIKSFIHLSEGETDRDVLELEMQKIGKYGRECVDIIIKEFTKASEMRKRGFLSLMALLGDESFKPVLLDFVYHQPAPFELIDKAIEVLNGMGESIDKEFLKDYYAAEEWTVIAEKRFQEFTSKESPAISLLTEEFLTFSPALQSLILENLGRSRQKAYVPFLRSLWGKMEGMEKTILDLMVQSGTKEAGEFLQEVLFSLTDKKSRKEIKKVIYRLKSKGIELEEKEAGGEEDAAFDFSLPVEEKAFVSKPDFLGERLIWYTSPNKFGWLDTFQGFVSASKGLIKFSYIEMARKDFRDFFRHLKTERRLVLVEIDPVEVKWIVEQAAECSNELPEDFKKWRNRFGEPEKREKPETLAQSISAEVTEALREQVKNSLDRYLQEEEFAPWIIEFDKAMEYTNQIVDATTGPLVVNETLRQERVRDIIRKAVKDYYSPERCHVYRYRLEELAKVQKILGKNEQAQQIWALSEHFANAEAIETNAFAVGIVERSIDLLMEEYKKRQEASLIKPPAQKDFEKPSGDPSGLIK